MSVIKIFCKMYKRVSLASLLVSCARFAAAAENPVPDELKSIEPAFINMRYIEADE